MDGPFGQPVQELPWDDADDHEVDPLMALFDSVRPLYDDDSDADPFEHRVVSGHTAAKSDAVEPLPYTRANALATLFDRNVRCVYVGDAPYVVIDFALALAIQALRGKPLKCAALMTHARGLQARCCRLYGHLLNDGDAVRLSESIQPMPYADPPFDGPVRAPSSSSQPPIAYSASGLRWLMVCAGGRKGLDDALNTLLRTGALERVCVRLDAEVRVARSALSSVTLSVCDGRTAPMIAVRHPIRHGMWTIVGSDASGRTIDAEARVARALLAATAARARRDGAMTSLFVDDAPVVLPIGSTIAFERALSGAFGTPRHGTPSVAAVPLSL